MKKRVPNHGFNVVCGMAVLIIFSIALASCGSSKKTVADKYTVTDTRKKDKDKNDRKKHKTGAAASHQLADALLAEARSWIGTPYRYGGTTKNGADCSGFIMEVYRKVAGIKIPRSSRQQQNYCEAIDKEDLTVGDLIFFSSNASNGKIAHVGMYIGDGQMIHASSSRGVIKTDISQNYYVRHYRASGRIPLIAQLVPITRQPEKQLTRQPKPAAADTITITTTPATITPATPVTITDHPAATQSTTTTTTTTTNPAAVVKNAFNIK